MTISCDRRRLSQRYGIAVPMSRPAARSKFRGLTPAERETQTQVLRARQQRANDAGRAASAERIRRRVLEIRSELGHNPRAIELGWIPGNKRDEPAPTPTEKNGS